MKIAKKILAPARRAFSEIIDNIVALRYLGRDAYHRYVTDDRSFLDEGFLERKTLKVLVYARNFPAFGGGEKHMAYFCKYFEDAHPTAEIHILVENSRTKNVFADDYPGLDRFKGQFNFELTRTRILKRHSVDQDFLSRLSFHYDIFINSTIRSRFYGMAKKNYYNCMFPPTPEDGFNLGDSVLRKSYDCFITNSMFTDRWLHQYWGSEIKSLCVYPPVFSISDLAARDSETAKRNVVLTVGRFFFGAHSKRQDAMIDFWLENEKDFSGWEFHLVGNRQENAVDIKYIDRIIRRTKNSKSIFLHFDTPFNELENLYRAAKIYWHAAGFGLDENKVPAKMEHFGITTVEAMSYGVVPVVIDKGGQREIVDDGQNGFKWSDDAHWLRQTRQLMTNESLRTTMAKNARAKAGSYTIEAFYQKCDALFGSPP